MDKVGFSANIDWQRGALVVETSSSPDSSQLALFNQEVGFKSFQSGGGRGETSLHLSNGDSANT